MVYKEGRLIFISETDSTNNYMQLLIRTQVLTDETVVWTDFQTFGRGQTGNSWESESGKNLLFSIFFCPDQLPAGQPFVIAELVSLCVKRTLDKLVPGVTIKWPNDIYLNDRKICGILIENQLTGGFIHYSIIGIGLNLNQDMFYSNAPNPVSLKQLTGYSYDRLEILGQLRRDFREIREQFAIEGTDTIHRAYMQSLYRGKGFHPFSDKDGSFEACIHHVELSGHLVLQRKNGVLSTYAFKEVSFSFGKFLSLHSKRIK